MRSAMSKALRSVLSAVRSLARRLPSTLNGKPDLVQAQARAFSRQVPLLYLILLSNTAILSFTHYGVAPKMLTLYIPAVLATICVARLVRWWSSRNVLLDETESKRLLGATTPLAAVLGAAFTAWSFFLFPYGDAYQQSHVFFYMSITVIGCIFCLMHLPSAALTLTGVVILPLGIFFSTSDQPVFVAMAVNVSLVSVAMIAILACHYGEFVDLIGAQRALIAQNAQTQKLSDENHRLANLDTLTELPNRRRFLEELSLRLDRTQGEPAGFVVGMVDLDGFKPVNDSFGHAIGDKLLIQVAGRLSVFPCDRFLVARLGGDEFGLIIDGDLSDAEIGDLGRRLCSVLGEPYVLPSVIAPVSASVGFCRYPDGGRTAEQLFEHADYALYHAKRTLRGSAVIFDDRHSKEIRALAAIETALRHADLEREVRPVFQPIVDAQENRTIGFEALARWDSPVLGSVSPAIFIAAAERLGLIGTVTEMLAYKVLRTVAEWPMDLRVSFNLSAKDIASPDTVNHLVEIVHASLVQPHRIDFEITETALVNDFDQAKIALQTLRDLGARTSLDDFGTGYSSLSHVRQLPLDKLKVDRSFVAEMEHHQPSRDIVKAVLDLAHNLHFDCVVEGVETADQAALILELGGRLMQGYHFARPLEAEAVEDYLRTESRRAARKSQADARTASDGAERPAHETADLSNRPSRSLSA